MTDYMLDMDTAYAAAFPDYDAMSEERLAWLASKGDIKAKEVLWEKVKRYVFSAAYKKWYSLQEYFRRAGLTLEDIQQETYIAFEQHIKKFMAEYGRRKTFIAKDGAEVKITFRTNIWRTVKWHMTLTAGFSHHKSKIDGHRLSNKKGGQDALCRADSIDEYFDTDAVGLLEKKLYNKADGEPSLEEKVYLLEVQRIVRESIATLTDDERQYMIESFILEEKLKNKKTRAQDSISREICGKRYDVAMMLQNITKKMFSHKGIRMLYLQYLCNKGKLTNGEMSMLKWGDLHKLHQLVSTKNNMDENGDVVCPTCGRKINYEMIVRHFKSHKEQNGDWYDLRVEQLEQALFLQKKDIPMRIIAGIIKYNSNTSSLLKTLETYKKELDKEPKPRIEPVIKKPEKVEINMNFYRDAEMLGVKEEAFEKIVDILNEAQFKKHKGNTQKYSIPEIAILVLKHKIENCNFSQLAAIYGVHKTVINRNIRRAESVLINYEAYVEIIDSLNPPKIIEHGRRKA